MRTQAAIIGIGRTEYSKNSGRSPLRLAIEATQAALDDAGLRPSDVNGIVKMSVQSDAPDYQLARGLGLTNLEFFADSLHGGGGGCGAVALADAAVRAGVADVVIAYRALNGRSGSRYGNPMQSNSVGGERQFTTPHGLLTPAMRVAMFAQRYLYQYHLNTDAFASVAIQTRAHAAKNPHAMMRERPITLEDHHNSRWISEPLRLFDCCLETDGACTVVVASADRARASRIAPAYIKATAMGSGSQAELLTSYQRRDITVLEEAVAIAERLLKGSGLRLADVNAFEIYDHFTPMVLMAVEAMGLASPGCGAELFTSGRASYTGDRPVNTHGGHLGEGYLHGFGHIYEAVSQLRGSAANQVHNCRNVLVLSAVGMPTSGLILGRD